LEGTTVGAHFIFRTDMPKKLEDIERIIKRIEEEILSASNWGSQVLFGLSRALEIIKEETNTKPKGDYHG